MIYEILAYISATASAIVLASLVLFLIGTSKWFIEWNCRRTFEGFSHANLKRSFGEEEEEL